MEGGFLESTFQTFLRLFVIRKIGQWKIFRLVSRKVFPFILGGKYFSEVVKKLEMLYYLMIISNLILKLLIAIYFVLNIFF
jgi:hypothetical protein